MKKQLSFASKIENISYVEKLVDEISDTYNLNNIIYGNILVSLVEAVSNAILHGNKSDPSKKVNVECEVEDNYIYFTICDEGDGFDFTNIPDPTATENIDKPHGRGVFLMNKLSDGISYQKNGTEVKFKFKLN